MPTTPYMKLYIGDYLGDTQHLSCLEHGAYLLLIMAYWQKGGPLENNPKILRRLTRTDPKTFQKCSKNVLNMFQVRDGSLVHKRIQKELEKRIKVSEHNRNSANSRWSERNANALPTQCERNAIPIFHSPESREDKDNTNTKRASPFVKPTLEEVRSYCLERGRGIDPEAWFDHYESNGWMVGKNHMKDWRGAVRTWERSGFNKPAPKKEGALALRDDAWTKEDQEKQRREIEEKGGREEYIDLAAMAKGTVLGEILGRTRNGRVD